MSSVNQFKDTIIYGNFQNKDNYKSGGNIANGTFDRSITVGLTGYFKNSIGVTGDANVYGNIKGNTGFFNNGLGVTGNINASNSLIVGSTGYFNNSIGVTGNVNISNTLSVGSTGYFNIIGVTGSIKLPNNQVINTTTPTLLTSNSSISDSQLSSNVCLLDATPSFTSGLTINGSVTLPNTQVINSTSPLLATTEYVNVAVSNLVNSAPLTLNTLNELATALGNDPNFATTMTNLIGTKQPLLTNNSILDSYLSSNVCLLNGTQTLINKTLTTPIIASIKPTSALTLTLPSLTDTLISRTSTDTLTNKTLTTPIIASIKPTSALTLTLPSLTDTLISRTSTDTLTNKTINDCIANTQLTTDNSTKIASTAFVKNAISEAIVGDGQISSNVCLLNRSNTFTNANLFTGIVSFQFGGSYLSTIFANNNLFSFTNSNLGGTIEFFCNTLTTANLVSPLKLSYTGLITDNITMNANQSLTMSSGTGVINQQGGSGTNTLKSSTFSGNTTIQSGSSLILKNSLNTISTQISQNGATLKFTNPSTPSQYLFEAYDGFGTLYPYTFGSTFSCGADITLNNYDLILSGTANIDQTSSTGVNVMGAITMNSNSNITLSGTGRIDQTSSTGQNIFNTIKFNPSTSNKQITLYENSATNLATNYTISVEGSTMRYNVNSGASHLFSTGTGISTYSTHATINSTGLTMAGNRNIIQSGTGILSQTGTGINLMKNITMNQDNNLLQSGIGVIQQSGTGTNALKGSTFSGSNTHYNGSLITQYDNTNTYYTQSSQVGADYYITNGGGSINLNATEVNLTNSYTTLKGGTSLSGYFTHFPYTDGYNYITGSTIMRGGRVEITDGVLSMKNDNGINFFDTATPVAQYSIFQNNGYLNFHNYAEPINTGFPTQINFAVYNLNPTVPRFHNRLTIDYTAVQVRKTVFQVYDYDENGCCELQQTTGNSTILRNKTNNGSMILQTTDSGGSAVSNITMTPTNTTIGNDLVCNGATQFNNDLTIYTSGSNYLKLSDGISSTRQYQSSGDCVIENTKTYAGGFGDIIFSTKNTGGAGAERFRISHDRIKTSVNITLPTTFTYPTSGQLGYTHQGTILYVATPQTITTNTPYYLASMILPVGVWNVFGSFAYYVATGGTMSYEQYSISANSVVVADNNLLTIGRYTTETGRYMVNRINTIYVSNGTQPVYLTFKLIFSGGGSYQYNNTTQTTYVNFYAVRIA